METGIRVGHDSTGKAVQEVAEALTAILAAGFAAHADRDVMVTALTAFREATSINGLTIRESTVGDTHNHYALELDPADEDDQ